MHIFFLKKLIYLKYYPFVIINKGGLILRHVKFGNLFGNKNYVIESGLVGTYQAFIIRFFQFLISDILFPLWILISFRTSLLRFV